MEVLEKPTLVGKKLFNEKYCEIMLLPNGILHAKWSGFLLINQIQKGCRFMSAYIKDNGVKGHMSDHTNLKVLTEDCKDYLTQEWFAEVEGFGLTKVAAVVSPNIYTRSSIDDVNSQVKLGNLTIETFNLYKDAENWILKK